MKAYEGGSAAYFATPPVNLIRAYHESLSQITKASPSLDERLERHRETSNRIKAAAAELGLSQLPLHPEIAANGMTAVSTSSPVTYFVSGLVDKLFLSCSSGVRKVSNPPSFCPPSCKRVLSWQVV